MKQYKAKLWKERKGKVIKLTEIGSKCIEYLPVICPKRHCYCRAGGEKGKDLTEDPWIQARTKTQPKDSVH